MPYIIVNQPNTMPMAAFHVDPVQDQTTKDTVLAFIDDRYPVGTEFFVVDDVHVDKFTLQASLQ